MSDDRRREPPGPSGGEQSATAARKHALESRLQEITAEIERLRRERKKTIDDFRAFTGKQGAQAVDAGPASPDEPRSARQGGLGAHGLGALETYAAELADRRPRAPFSGGEVSHTGSHVDRRPLLSPARPSRGPLRLIVPVVVLAAVAAGTYLVAGRWTRPEPGGPNRAAPLGAAEPVPAPTRADAGEPALETSELPVPVGTSGTAQGHPLRLELATVRAVWMRAIVDDQAASVRLMAAGETLTIEADRFVELRLGDAGAVMLRLNGEDVGPVGRDGEVLTRRFEAAPIRPEP